VKKGRESKDGNPAPTAGNRPYQKKEGKAGKDNPVNLGFGRVHVAECGGWGEGEICTIGGKPSRGKSKKGKPDYRGGLGKRAKHSLS